MHICGDEHYAALTAIVTEIADSDPITDHEQGEACFYCDAREHVAWVPKFKVTPLKHKDDCLYLRARKVIYGD